MKKITFLIGIAALALASCSNDDEPQDSVIIKSFGQTLGEVTQSRTDGDAVAFTVSGTGQCCVFEETTRTVFRAKFDDSSLEKLYLFMDCPMDGFKAGESVGAMALQFGMETDIDGYYCRWDTYILNGLSSGDIQVTAADANSISMEFKDLDLNYHNNFKMYSSYWFEDDENNDTRRYILNGELTFEKLSGITTWSEWDASDVTRWRNQYKK